jgi:putative endonuclease
MARAARLNRKSAERAGRRAETLAALWLRLKGYRIVAQRYRTRVGEIDLVARRAGCLAIIEVKQRARGGGADTAVGPRSERRIAAAAEIFLARRPDLAGRPVRYDIVTVEGWRLRHIRDAFRPGWQEGLVNPDGIF